LKQAAVKASLLAILLILIYITVRFEFRSGLAAIITLCHDICVMMAFFAIFQLPVNLNFIAAALTILGYSINATIVVFDRIRENSKGISDLKIFADATDRSIRQTLSRSINTSVTTLIPVLLILILGVPSIQNFAIALVVGIISGTYSSVFISGPLWVNLKKIGSGKSAAAAKQRA
jgi:preprotein translocase subunit SecF